MRLRAGVAVAALLVAGCGGGDSSTFESGDRVWLSVPCESMQCIDLEDGSRGEGYVAGTYQEQADDGAARIRVEEIEIPDAHPEPGRVAAWSAGDMATLETSRLEPYQAAKEQYAQRRELRGRVAELLSGEWDLHRKANEAGDLAASLRQAGDPFFGSVVDLLTAWPRTWADHSRDSCLAEAGNGQTPSAACFEVELIEAGLGDLESTLGPEAAQLRRRVIEHTDLTAGSWDVPKPAVQAAETPEQYVVRSAAHHYASVCAHAPRIIARNGGAEEQLREVRRACLAWLADGSDQLPDGTSIDEATQASVRALRDT